MNSFRCIYSQDSDGIFETIGNTSHCCAAWPAACPGYFPAFSFLLLHLSKNPLRCLKGWTSQRGHVACYLQSAVVQIEKIQFWHGDGFLLHRDIAHGLTTSRRTETGANAIASAVLQLSSLIVNWGRFSFEPGSVLLRFV
eukprot:scaffold292827_cov34-Prasinocladus_malaysianus.AAC.2